MEQPEWEYRVVTGRGSGINEQLRNNIGPWELVSAFSECVPVAVAVRSTSPFTKKGDIVLVFRRKAQ